MNQGGTKANLKVKREPIAEDRGVILGLKKETLALLMVFISLFGRIILSRMSATFWISSCSNTLNLSDSFPIRGYHLLGKRSRPQLSLATENFPELALTAAQR